MGAFADIYESERGILAALLILGATVGLIMGKVTFDQWSTYTLTIFGMFAAAKTVTGGIQIWKSAKATTSATITPDSVTATRQGDPSSAPAGGAS